MMTETLGVVMWLMMGLMIAGIGGGAIAWVRRRPRERAAQRPQPQPPEDNLRRRPRRS